MVHDRIQRVREFRVGSRSKPTQELAISPTSFHVTVIPSSEFLVIPEVSSERRDFVPIGWLEPPIVPSNLVRVLPNASLGLFGLLTSSMHMSWLRHVGGRLESRYRYSIGLVYNTFPVPVTKLDDLQLLEPEAERVLDARDSHLNMTPADLYDPDTMPADLRKAHKALDRAVDRLYRKQKFGSDRERAEYLLGLYEQMIAPPLLPRIRPIGRVGRRK